VFSPVSHTVDIYRIGIELEKVCQKKNMASTAQCLQFSQSGKYCAMGFKDGHLKVMKTENLEEISSQKLSDFAIVQLTWFSQSKPDNKDDEDLPEKA